MYIFAPAPAGIFTAGNTDVVVSITINGQTVATGNSGSITLPSGESFTLTVGSN